MVTLRLPQDVLSLLDDAARRYGFSRNDFVIQMIRAFHDFKTLNPEERVFIMHLTLWGVSNFRDGRPTLRRFAGESHITEDGVRELVERFIRKGWMEKRPSVVAKRFNYDLTIDGAVYGLTDAGLRVAGFAQ